MQILLPQFKIGFALHQSRDNLLLQYASLILSPKKKPSTPATYNSPKSFLQLNVKTKLTTPLPRKKRKRLENCETTCLCQPSGKWKQTHWRPNYFVTFYVFHIFHPMLNIPILHRLTGVKSRTI